MHTIKCVVVGDRVAGKTDLLYAFTTKVLPRPMPTIFEDYSAIVTISGNALKLMLCDTSGQEDYSQLRHLTYLHTDVFILCFSLASPTSFKNISSKWAPELRKHCPNTPIVLVGTRSELRDSEEYSESYGRRKVALIAHIAGLTLADQIKAVKYVECSAVTHQQLNNVFEEAISAVLAAYDKRTRDDLQNAIII